MIQQEINLYPEPLPPIIPIAQSYFRSIVPAFSQVELSKAVSLANMNKLFLGTTFHYANNPKTFYIKRFETRPAYVDDIDGNPAVIIAGTAGDITEVPFSVQEILTLKGK